MNIRVSDIKQYFYCPRVVYHTYLTPVHRPTTHPMQLGAVEHEVLSVLERRRPSLAMGLRLEAVNSISHCTPSLSD